MKVTVYTAIYGNYDQLLPVMPQDIDCEFICFSDRPMYSNTWKVVIKDFIGIPNTLKARYIKTHSHSLIDGPSIWIDGNIIINRTDTISNIVSQFKGGILTMKHLDRNNILEEMAEVQRLERFQEYKDIIDIQRKLYMDDGYTFDNGLSLTSIMMRDNNKETRKFNKMWREHILQYCYRDQCSMHYVAWKTGIQIHHLDWSIYDVIYAKLRWHML